MGKYNVGDKFIVEIKEVINSENGTLYRSNFKTLVFDDYGLDSLHQAITPAEDGLVDKAEVAEAYNKGLQDAWELANRLFGYSCDTKLTNEDLKKIFGSACEMDILRNFTPQEALAKLEEYEIKVGDVVEYINGDLYLIITEEDDCTYNFGVIDLQTMKTDKINTRKSRFKKTGKHIDIQSILQQIGGDADV